MFGEKIRGTVSAWKGFRINIKLRFSLHKIELF